MMKSQETQLLCAQSTCIILRQNAHNQAGLREEKPTENLQPDVVRHTVTQNSSDSIGTQARPGGAQPFGGRMVR